MQSTRTIPARFGRPTLGAGALIAFIAALTAQAWSLPAIAQQTVDEIKTIEVPRDEGPDPFVRPEDRDRVAPLEWAEEDPKSPAEKQGDEPSLTPAVESGGAAAPGAAALARSHFPDAWSELEALDRLIDNGELEPDTSATSVAKGTAGVFTRYSGNINTQMWQFSPWNKIGKLYFTVPGAGNSYCTANVISRNNIIVTAAHCLYTRGRGWHTNFRFVPADRAGVAPYGVYGWLSAGIMTNWITVGGRRWDVGMVRLSNNLGTGIPVSSYVGWLGRTWNQGYVQNLHSIGYASNFSTQYTHICTAESFNGGLDVLAKGCDMTYGSSGGGWLLQYHPYSSATNRNIVNGVTSGPYPGGFGTTFVGPRFSSANFVPLCSFYSC